MLDLYGIPLEESIDSDIKKMARFYIDNFLHGLEMPDFKIKNNMNSSWLGKAIYKAGVDSNGNRSGMTRPEVHIQKSITHDPKSLERIVAHELIHCYEYQIGEWYVKFFSSNGETQRRMKRYQPDGHGKFFNDYASAINAVKGENFVHKTSDEEIKHKYDDKLFYVFIEHMKAGNLAISTFIKKTSGIKEEIKRRKSYIKPDGSIKASKLFQVSDRDLIMPDSLGKYGKGRYKVRDDISDKVQSLWDSGDGIDVEEFTSESCQCCSVMILDEDERDGDIELIKQEFDRQFGLLDKLSKNLGIQTNMNWVIGEILHSVDSNIRKNSVSKLSSIYDLIHDQYPNLFVVSEDYPSYTTQFKMAFKRWAKGFVDCLNQLKRRIPWLDVKGIASKVLTIKTESVGDVKSTNERMVRCGFGTSHDIKESVWTRENSTRTQKNNKSPGISSGLMESKSLEVSLGTLKEFCISNQRIASQEIHQYFQLNQIPDTEKQNLLNILKSGETSKLKVVSAGVVDKDGQCVFRIAYKSMDGYSEEPTNYRVEFEAVFYPEYSQYLTLTFLRIGHRREFKYESGSGDGVTFTGERRIRCGFGAKHDIKEDVWIKQRSTLNSLTKCQSQTGIGSIITESLSNTLSSFVVSNQQEMNREIHQFFLKNKSLSIALKKKLNEVLSSSDISYLEQYGDVPKFGSKEENREYKVRLKFQDGFSDDSIRLIFHATEYLISDSLLLDFEKIDFRKSVYKSVDESESVGGYKIVYFDNHKEAGKFVDSTKHDFIQLFPSNLMNKSVYALKDGEIVGFIQFTTRDNNLIAIDTRVKEDHRRKGLASAMYDKAEAESGLIAIPSDNQTSDAKAFWKYRQKTGGNKNFGEATDPKSMKFFFSKTGLSKFQHSILGSDKHALEIGKNRSGHAYTFLPHRISFYIELFGEPDFFHIVSLEKSNAIKAVYAEAGSDMIQLWSYVDTRQEAGWKEFERQAAKAGYKIKDFRKGQIDDSHGYWLDETKDPRRSGYQFTKKENGANLVVKAWHGGEKVGEMECAISQSQPGKLYPLNVIVDQDHRRKGIATELYKIAEKHFGLPFAHGNWQTREGKKFRKSYDKNESKTFGRKFFWRIE